jgi:hypothetical protein
VVRRDDEGRVVVEAFAYTAEDVVDAFVELHELLGEFAVAVVVLVEEVVDTVGLHHDAPEKRPVFLHEVVERLLA